MSSLTEIPVKATSQEKQERYDRAYLKMAIEWARLSHCNRKKVGSLLVKDGMIISDGYNGTPSGFPNHCEDEAGDTLWYVLHAEANAIMKVARSTNNAQGSTLYITLSPCKECCKLILQAGIRR
ncbi:MAG: CMP deaminase, partial [Flavobacteriales bacterium]|nr:CMP deaminase [Flavobacteriales bacterium]